MRIRETATVHTSTSGAIVFSQMARRMSEAAARLDSTEIFERLAEPERQHIQDQLLDASLAAVIASYTYIEALANELFLDTVLFGRPFSFPDISQVLAQNLASAWIDAKDKGPVDKLKHALKVAGCADKIKWGSGVPQQLCVLQRLRNALIHHEPIMVEHGKPSGRSDDKLEQQLHSRFQKALIWEGRGVAFRWYGCLGGPCAQWAYRTATSTAAAVFASIGTRYPT